MYRYEHDHLLLRQLKRTVSYVYPLKELEKHLCDSLLCCSSSLQDYKKILTLLKIELHFTSLTFLEPKLN